MMKYLLFIIICLNGFYIYGQDPPFRQYTIDDGLPSNGVYGAIQDHQGFMWVYGEFGVCRFDGSEFEYMDPHKDKGVEGIYFMNIDKNGRLWPLCFRSPFHYYTGNRMHLVESDVDYIYRFDPTIDQYGNVGFSYDIYNYRFNESLQRIDTDTFTCSEPKNRSNLFLNQPFLGFHTDKTLQVTEPPCTLTQEIKFNNTLGKERTAQIFYTPTQQTIVFNNDTVLWNNNQEHLLYTLDTYFTKPVKRVAFQKLADNTIILSCSQGYIRFDCLGNVVDHRTFPILSKKYSFYRFYFDRENNLWAGTIEGGLFLFTREQLRMTHKSFDNDNRKNDIRYSELLSEREFLALSYDGSAIIADVENDTYDIVYETNATFRPDALMVSHPDSFTYILDARTVRMSRDKKKWTSNVVVDYLSPLASMLRVNDSLVIGHNASDIKILNANDVSLKDTIKLPTSTRTPTYNDSTLFIYQPDGILSYNLRTKKRALLIDKRLKGYVKLFRHQDLLLINTDRRELLLCRDSTVIKELDFGYRIYDSYSMDDKNVLFGTDRGLVYAHIDASDSLQIISVWDESKGMPFRSIRTMSVSDSLLFLGTNNGMLTMPLQMLSERNNLRPSIQYTLWREGLISKASSATYRGARYPIVLQAMAVSYRSHGSAQVLYRYRGGAWNIMPSEGIDFNLFSPRKYTIELKAVDAYGQESDVEQIEINLQRPLWRSRLAQGAYLVCFAILLYFLNRRRLTFQLNRQKELRQLDRYRIQSLTSQINPHFIFNALASIQYFIEMGKSSHAENYLLKFSNLLRSYFGQMDQEMISIKDEHKLLQHYLEIERLRFEGRFEYDIQIDDELDLADRIPSMTVQPLVESIINHAFVQGEQTLMVRVQCVAHGDDAVMIQIHDNGLSPAQALKRMDAPNHEKLRNLKDRFRTLERMMNLTLESQQKSDNSGNTFTVLIRYN